ncbi:MAG: hypothetical protein K1X78_05410 [Verrucomicrobiaceae bacterium]|nr:hypothetical protein [Verrucomicrobiaceae bacterium]
MSAARTMKLMRRLLPQLLLVAFALACAGCKKQEKPKSAKQQREDIIRRGNEEQAALGRFTAAVREIIVWRQSQPDAADAAARGQLAAALAQRMEKVPVAGLADDLAKAWPPMLKAWRDLAKAGEPAESLREAGARAAADINRCLSAHGVTDIRF